MQAQADIGIIGGSGFYQLLTGMTTRRLDTPYGAPSDELALGEYAGRRVAFLPRHGRGHSIPPHRINYRANLWALKEVGVSRIVAPCAVGSLRPDLSPRDFVVPDDFINFTSGREQTFHDGPKVLHVYLGDHRYCPDLRARALSALRALDLPAHDGGTIAVVNGPRFSTPAESRMLASWGADLVNMTQYPEAYLARELGLCYATIAVVTDWDCGVEGVPKSALPEMLSNFAANNEKLKAAIMKILEDLEPAPGTCRCHGVPGESAIN